MTYYFKIDVVRESILIQINIPRLVLARGEYNKQYNIIDDEYIIQI